MPGEILKQLPYREPFRFVDSLDKIDDKGAEGRFTFRKDLPFYQGHFIGYPVTPGVLLTECCAQIGLVCLGLYLAQILGLETNSFVLSSSEMQFFIPVYPEETVRVQSEKVYFRFNKLKCKVRMYNRQEQLVCSGFLSGMILRKEDE